ncbi:28S ribosomal protein S23, mitochondrial isoform X1 [Sceloporus undulatus]|uniref:28S ribosomal protein S23, mitochondrial isoform X1 n=1 Tax=Sceloporus undulatus TaxID=8520 RepID=UPI001C4BE0E0|nr:28S ribosomal protein S23, mitochondrial isoform X1 [Sceloporus undulatus]
MPEAKKPTWYDVYAAFPPLREPVYRNPCPRYSKEEDLVPPILYPEDKIRAKFYEAYGSGPRAFELSRLNFKSACQRFVEKYNELQKQGEMDDERLFEETGKALLAEGVLLRRKGVGNVTPEAKTRDPMLELRLQSMLQEMQDNPQEQDPEPMEEVPKEGPPSS